ncbi:SoxR reducing system RseC family protein [Clostridium sediminicola]|uniref:SoxR reducing system RseC family protein n=1 Tax=Clostridium sediminicola TaxID=3114879 RepID=UPI0031F274A3
MKEIGVVSQVNGEKAYVSFKRKSGCGDSCACCKTKCAAAFITTEIANPLNAKIGDKVDVEIENKSFNKMMFFAYMLPLILMMIGTAIGINVFRNLGYASYELFGFAIGMTFLALSYYLLKKINDKMRNDNELLMKITKILK